MKMTIDKQRRLQEGGRFECWMLPKAKYGTRKTSCGDWDRTKGRGGKSKENDLVPVGTGGGVQLF